MACDARYGDGGGDVGGGGGGGDDEVEDEEEEHGGGGDDDSGGDDDDAAHTDGKDDDAAADAADADDDGDDIVAAAVAGGGGGGGADGQSLAQWCIHAKEWIAHVSNLHPIAGGGASTSTSTSTSTSNVMSELALIPARYGERRVESLLPGAFELYKSLLPDKYVSTTPNTKQSYGAESNGSLNLVLYAQ